MEDWEKLERVIIRGCANESAKRGLINTAKDALEGAFNFRYCNMEGAIHTDCFPNPSRIIVPLPLFLFRAS